MLVIIDLFCVFKSDKQQFTKLIIIKAEFTENFCIIDEFDKNFEFELKKNLLLVTEGKKIVIEKPCSQIVK